MKFQTLNSRPFAGSFYKRGGSQEWHPKPGSWLTDINPARDADGFVERRPSMLEVDSDDVFYRDYHWVAMLDPLELSNCWFRSTQPALPPVEISDVRAVEHHDRRAWQAIAMPTTEYEPRCSCCALLGGDVVDDREQQWKPDVPSTVRLDAETGICVYVEHHGDAPSVELDVRIVAVDAAYPDDLFTRPTG